MSPLRFAVIGAPVGHSKSPAMHQAAYRALGLPHSYEKLETSESEVGARVEALRRGDWAGLNVTVPHKMRALLLADEIDPSAAATGAANTLVRSVAGHVRAHNTDAPALRDAIANLAPPGRLRGRSALVLGSGGAARAALFALGQLGVRHATVRARKRPDLESLARILATSGASATIAYEPLGAPSAGPDDLAVIVQATTAGMTGGDVPGSIVVEAISWPTVPRDCVIYDVVYTPRRTPFLEAAGAAGLANEGGLGMLVRQGALAFELWLGITPPLDVMTAALESSAAVL